MRLRSGKVWAFVAVVVVVVAAVGALVVGRGGSRFGVQVSFVRPVRSSAVILGGSAAMRRDTRLVLDRIGRSPIVGVTFQFHPHGVIAGHYQPSADRTG